MTPADFAYLRDMLKERSGLIVTEEKQYLLESRLMPLARKSGFQCLSELVAALRAPDGKALLEQATEAMTINESFFFRDKTPFENFENIMAPALTDARGAKRRLRIWCAAASTGQEPYSIAITIKEMERIFAGWTVEITGTDLSAEVLEKARAGLYSQFEVQRGMPIQMLVKYFQQSGSLWQIDSGLRSMVRYEQFNLLDDFSRFGTFDVVFCRNVLIYFDTDTKRDILSRIAKQLAPDGYLVLGAAETVIGITDDFAPVAGARGLYAHKDQGTEKAAPAAAAASAPLAAASAPLAASAGGSSPAPMGGTVQPTPAAARPVAANPAAAPAPAAANTPGLGAKPAVATATKPSFEPSKPAFQQPTAPASPAAPAASASPAAASPSAAIGTVGSAGTSTLGGSTGTQSTSLSSDKPKPLSTFARPTG